MDKYLDINKASWNRRTEVHVDSDFYDNEKFLQGQNSLKEIEMDLLGDIKGKDVIHLQCHFGQDSLSMARMGANVTGIDLSDAAIAKAREMNDQLGLNAKFYDCDVYDTAEVVNEQYDIVFTSYGVIGWLPDTKRWAEVVSKLLKPGGQLILVEFHPAVWMFDDDFNTVAYPYFNKGAIVETETGTYADRSANLDQQYVWWNHGLAEVIQALVSKGLRVSHFEEYEFSPYSVLNGDEEYEPGRFRIKKFGNKMPLVYSVMAEKR